MRHGPPDGRVLVFHVGTPNAPVAFPLLTDALDERGWQLVAYARPGYAGSARREGRSVADAAADTAAVLDELGLDRFVTIGWSGGGPHALACAALLPDRCEAAASLAGVAPFDAEGLDFLAGMGPENVEEFGAAARSRDELEAFLERFADGLATVTGEEIGAVAGRPGRRRRPPRADRRAGRDDGRGCSGARCPRASPAGSTTTWPS